VHPEFEAEKSNLTLTGELLDAIKVKWITARKVFAFTASSRRHKRYKTKKRSKAKAQPAKISDIIQWQQDSGRSLAQLYTGQFLKDTILKLRQSIIRFWNR
jgi:transposase